MASWVCKNDRVAYAVGMRACPQCGASDYVEEYSPEHEALLRDADRLDEVGLPDEERVPDGPAGDVLAWVGDDRGRAQHALTVERASARPRVTLVEKLSRLAGADEAGN